jgi:hypothetical protein
MAPDAYMAAIAAVRDFAVATRLGKGFDPINVFSCF